MTTEGRFAPGDRVRVLRERAGGNPRTPRYVKGRTGVVILRHGVVDNPLDHHHPYPPLYSVEFRVEDLTGPGGDDRVVADLHEEWLEPA